MISVFIPTKNEEQNLAGCLKSVLWADDVWVYDSGSTDATRAIAIEAGAHFAERPHSASQEIFGGDEAAHKNWALQNIPFKYPWVLHLDADERSTPELIANMQIAIASPGDIVAYRIQRRDFWGKQWLRHVVASPFYMRLFRPERMHFQRRINPVPVANGEVGELIGYIEHHPFNRGVAHWLNRHNSYSTLEAQEIREASRDFKWRRALFSKDFHERRFHQKQLFYHLPARPLIKFLLLYLGKRGFLDGVEGLRYALLQSFYEFMIVLKTKELGAGISTRADARTSEKRSATASTELPI